MLSKALQAAAGNGISTVAVAEAIDFDGTNDYLSRSSDLVGNADGKTFTFSAWVWVTTTAATQRLYLATDGSFNKLGISINTSGFISLVAVNAANTAVLSATASTQNIPINSFVNILVSVDLASTSNRSIYINDALATVSWSTYTNDTIDRTVANHYVSRDATGSQKVTGRLSNVFLDYTYRDLSVEANRRLFVTADLKPAAGQAALNPILYLPMDDPTQPGLNLGTGGNFTLTGVVARSGRGPNQFNAPYSDLDGTADYLSRTTAPTGIADGKQFTFDCVFNKDASTSIFYVASSTTSRFYVYVSDSIQVFGYNASGVKILQAEVLSSTFAIIAGRNYIVQVSIDLADAGKRHIIINGVSYAATWTSYTNDTINFNAATPRWRVGANSASTPTDYFNGRLGNVFFHTSYIDLSVPANLEKFVTGTGIDAKPVDLGANGELPFGTAPLIYLPMYGNNAGKNYGTGGDFTVNSGPYTGARGPSEFFGNRADFDGVSTTNLKKTGALSGVSATKTFSASFWVRFDVIDTVRRSVVAIATTSSTNGVLYLYASNTGTPTFYVYARPTPGGAFVLAATFTVAASTDYFIQMSVDLSNAANRSIYVNGAAASVTWSTYTDSTMAFNSSADTYVGSSALPETIDGKLSEFYFTTQYIDFSQEANRLKFRDAFGNPVDLTQQIEDAAIPNPVIYMRFDPASFGTNSGTGGDFTVNGTITDGGNL